MTVGRSVRQGQTCHFRMPSSSSPVSGKGADRNEPVAQPDLLSLLTAARQISYRHLHDARPPVSHLRGDFVIELEAARLERNPHQLISMKELQCGHRVGEIASCER